MERKLASVQRIVELTPIEGADRIEEATVMGWSVVVKKGEFEEGDLCVFFEVDSTLPKEAPWAAFMDTRRFRVKTIRLRKVLSQGLALPLSILPEGEYEEEDDVSELLGVTKWELPIPGEGSQTKGLFLPGVPKTDETRIQSSLRLLRSLDGKPYYFTQKDDGTSATYGLIDGYFSVCSKNLELKSGSGHYWEMAEKYHIEDYLIPGLVVQGEICGPGIQENRLGLEEKEFHVFNMFNYETQKYLNWDSVVEFCRLHDWQTVKELERGEAFSYSLPELLKKAEGTYPLSRKRREGIVVRSFDKQISFKVISNSFLLKDEI